MEQVTEAVFGLSGAGLCAVHGTREAYGAGSGLADGSDTPLRAADCRREGVPGPSEKSGCGRSTLVTEGVWRPLRRHNVQDAAGAGLWRDVPGSWESLHRLRPVGETHWRLRVSLK
ncbi:hypothetical protein NDU88_002968 [Pleurodeles waltl]|uniref:Uncharacterized protein n=1 Tax=Pleurodeles waltl TaxID=8319 RepID=A0AAV7M318_PLEWA|nr:hypothetical protein NDU88_002968 [Pleurodeles waltl]